MPIDLNILVLATPAIRSTSLPGVLENLGARSLDDAEGLADMVLRGVDVLVLPAREVMLQRRVLRGDVALLGIASDDPAVNSNAQAWTDGWLAPDAPTDLVEQELWSALRRHRAQHKHRLLQTVDAIGQFAGGAAHDFNNILTVLLGNLEMLQMSSLGEGDSGLVEDALSAAERGISVTRRMGHFSNRASDTQLLDLNAFARKVYEIIRQDLGESFDVSINLSSQDIPLVVNALRLEKVMLNLADNARDAMPNGGRLILETRRAPINPEFLHSNRGVVPSGDYALISLIDEGDGMSPDVAERATELFFSTRDRGRASGIGLSIASAFLQDDGGLLGIDSAPGAGTRMHCYLPLVDSEQIVMRGQASLPASSLENLRILVVEDDPMVSSSTSRMLEQLGHEVTVATNGYSALSMVSRQRNFDLVLSDVQMPGEIDGLELSKVLAEAFPRLPVLLFSGGDAAQSLVDGKRGRLLSKPFTLSDLEEALGRSIRARDS